MRDSGELVVMAVILGLFGAMAAAGWYSIKARSARLARLREAASITADSVSGKRILVVLLAGVVLTGASAPLFMAAFPRTPLMFLVSIGLAFAAAVAPLTFARSLTIEVRLLLDPSSLRLERRGARPIEVQLDRAFTVEAECIDGEMMVIVEQAGARVLFAYRQGQGAQAVSGAMPPEGWIGEDERFVLFDQEAAIIHERLERMVRP
jgi:hypothetical protein